MLFSHIIITLGYLIKNKSFDNYKNKRRIEHFNNVFVRLNTVGYPLSSTYLSTPIYCRA